MNLKQWMDESEYSHKQLADAVGVSLSLIYLWLNGERKPSSNNMGKLLKLSNNKIDANRFFK